MYLFTHNDYWHLLRKNTYDQIYIIYLSKQKLKDYRKIYNLL